MNLEVIKLLCKILYILVQYRQNEIAEQNIVGKLNLYLLNHGHLYNLVPSIAFDS